MKYKNNPFFIKRSYHRWFGSCASSKDHYECFERLEFGVRAFMILVREFCLNNPDHSIKAIISYFSYSHNKDFLSNFEYYVNSKFQDAFNVEFLLNLHFQPSKKSHFFVLFQSMCLFLNHESLSLDLLEKCWNYYHIANSKFPFE